VTVDEIGGPHWLPAVATLVMIPDRMSTVTANVDVNTPPTGRSPTSQTNGSGPSTGAPFMVVALPGT